MESKYIYVTLTLVMTLTLAGSETTPAPSTNTTAAVTQNTTLRPGGDDTTQNNNGNNNKDKDKDKDKNKDNNDTTTVLPPTTTTLTEVTTVVSPPTPCDPNPCGGNGTCQVDATINAGYRCVCSSFWSGFNCSEFVNHCDPNPCSPVGTVQCNLTESSPGYSCQCKTGYSGATCDKDDDPCDPLPCLNNGNCTAVDNSYQCTCTEAFTGSNCEQEIDFCAPVPCQNNATCNNFTGGYNCTCLQGFTGAQCQDNIDDCLNVTCNNSGTCEDGVDSFTCQCTAGWTGTLCETDINECDTVKPCDENADCLNLPGSYNCTCRASYSGDGQTCIFLSPCDSKPCGDNGLCMGRMNGYDCRCYNGWSGVNCSDDIDECSQASPLCAAPYGQCFNTPGGYLCNCTEGTWGDGYRRCVANILYPSTMVPLYSSRAQGDDELVPVYVPGGFSYLGQIYSDIYVSTNGYVSFGEPFTRSSPPSSGEFPSNVKMIAPYWMDLEPVTGTYLVVNQYNIFNTNKSEEIVNTTFNMLDADLKKTSTFQDFEPSFILVATWYRLAPYQASQYQRYENVTFQLVLATNSKSSISVINYDRERMLLSAQSNWTVLMGVSDGSSIKYPFNVTDKTRPDLYSNLPTPMPGRVVFPLGDPIPNKRLPCLDWYQRQNETMIREYRDQADPCPCTRRQAANDGRFMLDVTGTDCYIRRFTNRAVWNRCCFDSMGALVMNHGYSRLVVAADTAADRDVCCADDVRMCHLFYVMRPSDDCSTYRPPVWAAGWGKPHMKTFDGGQYTFNELGEFILMTAAGGFMLQGRTSRVTDVTANVTAFSAFAAKNTSVGSTLPHLELRVLGGLENNIEIMVDGQLQLTMLSLNTTLKFPGMHIIGNNQHESLLVQFDNDVGLKVTMQQKFLSIRVTVPEWMKTTANIQGMLGSFDGNKDNDLTYRDGLAMVPPSAVEEQIQQFALSWQVDKNESIFTYSLDVVANKIYETFNPPGFSPMRFADALTNLSSVEGINVTLAETVCGTERVCLVDYIATRNINIAAKTLQTKVENEEFAVDMAVVPPKWASTMPPIIKAAVGDNFAFPLKAEGQGTITYKVEANDQSGFSLSNSIFQWSPHSNFTQDNSSASFKFYAVGDQGQASLYWPVIELNACRNGQGNHDYRQRLDYEFSPDQFYQARCACGGGYSGASCSEWTDPCLQEPCYPRVECTTLPGTPEGYTCADCPAGLQGSNGSKCYDVNECLLEKPVCSQTCQNILGGYTCLCDPGFELADDKSTCIDVDECTLGKPYHNCTGVGEYCSNIPGGFTCACRAQGYYRDQGKCLTAGRRYGGQLAFQAIEMNSAVYSWDPEMTDPDSEMFQGMAALVEEQITKVYQNDAAFKKAKVYKAMEGSIVTIFDLFYGEAGEMNSSMLNERLQAYLETRDCVREGPDCSLGPLLGVLVQQSMAEAKDLCVDREDNDCDDMSTQCTSELGKFSCSCLTGYRRWLDYTNICQDIDECEDGGHTCDNATSACNNLPGTYECVCSAGFWDVNGTCTDVCETNPCLNDGECQPSGNTFYCKCNGRWAGKTCEEENEEAIKLRNIAIGVGVGIGAICLILLIILIVSCVRSRHQHRKYSYTCRPVANEEKYRGASADRWGDAGTVPIRSNLKSEYEMRENGSNDSLVDDATHRYQEPSRVAPGYPSQQGVENPSYSSVGEVGSHSGGNTANVPGEYF